MTVPFWHLLVDFSSHIRHWDPIWLWRLSHPRRFWLGLFCILRNALTIPTAFFPAPDGRFRNARQSWLWILSLCL